MQTIPNMATISEPAAQRNDRDLESSPAEEAVLHFRERVGHLWFRLNIDGKELLVAWMGIWANDAIELGRALMEQN